MMQDRAALALRPRELSGKGELESSNSELNIRPATTAAAAGQNTDSVGVFPSRPIMAASKRPPRLPPLLALVATVLVLNTEVPQVAAAGQKKSADAGGK